MDNTSYLTVPMKPEIKAELHEAAAENGRAAGREAERFIEAGLAARRAEKLRMSAAQVPGD